MDFVTVPYNTYASVDIEAAFYELETCVTVTSHRDM